MVKTMWSPVAVALLASLAAAAPAAPQPGFPTQDPGGAPTQYDIQSVYLFDFAKFVRWPAASENGTLVICVAGRKEYADTLSKTVAGERVENHPLVVRAIDGAQEESGCDILFIGDSAKEPMDRLLAPTAGKAVLTVSDVPGFLDRGGMIQFVTIGHRVRFSVDLRPVERAGISLSSELLKVAVAVNGQPGGGRP